MSDAIGSLAVPDATRFSAHPASWYVLCSASELTTRAPLRRELCGRALVAFRAADGRPGVLDARCPHLGADLGAGRVTRGRLQCSYHGWAFDASGLCAERRYQHASYPVEERFGQVFVFLGPKASFPLPAFDDCAPEAMISAPAAKLTLRAPWYMVAAQAFDMQHFRMLHHRELLGDPVIDAPHPFARRIVCRFAIRGGSWVDRVTTWVSGDVVEFSITVWGGNIVLVRTRFRKDRTYGVVVVEPRAGAAGGALELTMIANAARGGSTTLDRVRVIAKRFAILHMMRDDLPVLNGLEYHARGLGADDGLLIDYLTWVASLGANAGP